MTNLQVNNQKKYDTLILVLAIAVPLLVAILFGLRTKVDLGTWTKVLPHLNGLLNSMTAFLLVLGFVFIKRKDIAKHRVCMLGAFSFGSVFLISYVLYHLSNASTPFGGEGFIMVVYYVLLISHVILAAIVVPFVLYAVYFGITMQIDRHKKLVKWTLPIWLYVSITGVLVYLMISPYYS